MGIDWAKAEAQAKTLQKELSKYDTRTSGGRSPVPLPTAVTLPQPGVEGLPRGRATPKAVKTVDTPRNIVKGRMKQREGVDTTDTPDRKRGGGRNLYALEQQAAYNDYLEQQKEYERLSGLDLDELRASLEELNGQLEEAKQAKTTASNMMAGINLYSADLEEKTAIYDDLQSQVTALQRDIQQAERIQKGNQYNAYLKEGDFARYSAQGAAIENPAFGYHSDLLAVGEGPSNIVTYSRENWKEIARGEANGRRMTGRSLYRYMTDDEVSIYNYLLAKDGADVAQEYLDYLEETLNYRAGTEQGENIRGIENGVGRTLATGLYGFGAGLDQWASGVRQLFSEERLPTTATQYGSAYIREDLTETGPRIAGGSLGQMAYDATTIAGNMAPSILVSAVTAGAGAPATAATIAGAATLGGSSAGNAYSQKLAEGYSAEKARTYAALVGASEAGLQYLLGGIGALGGVTDDILLAKVASIDNALARVALTGTVKIGSEITEEELQLCLEPAFDSLIFGTEYDAPTFEDMAYTAIVTALSTGLLESGNIAAAGFTPTSPVADVTATAPETQKTASTGEAGVRKLTMADFTNVDSPVWNNVAYEDTTTQSSIMQKTHQEMVDSGNVVQIPDTTMKQVGQAYPDLRTMKKAERTPILREKINELKTSLRSFLNGLKGGSFEFEVNGNILEAKLYDTGVKEVMEKITQDKASVLYHSDQIFQNARYLYSTPDYDGNPNIYRWNYFYTPVQIGDETVGVRIAVRDMAKTQESQIYNWNIKKDAVLGGGGGGSAASHTNASSTASSDAILGGGGRGQNRISSDTSSTASVSDPIIRRGDPGVNPQSAQGGRVVFMPGSGLEESARRVEMLPRGDEAVTAPQGEEAVSVAGEETEATQGPDLLATLDTKAQGHLRKAKNRLTKRVADLLDVPKAASRETLKPIVEDMVAEYFRTGQVSQESREALFERAYQEGIIIDSEFYEQYKDIRGYLRNQPLTISAQDRGDIADFNDFRKRAFGTLKIVNSGGMPVDVAYQELHARAPELFPDQFVSPSDQLVRLFEVVKSIQKTERTLAEWYGVDAETFRSWAKREFDEAVDEGLREMELMRRYAEDKITEKTAETETEAPTTQEEVMDSVGAAPLGFDPYSRLQSQTKKYHPDGEKAYRMVDVPTKDFDGRNIPKAAATVLEASVTPDSAVAVIQDAIAKGEFSFETITDKSAERMARRTVDAKGWEKALEHFHQEALRGVVSKEHIALGQILLNNAMNSGDSKAGETVVQILTDYASMSTTAAQSLQAQRMLKKMSPEGQLYGVQRSVSNMQEELNKRYGKKAPELTIPEELVQDFLNAKDQEGRDTAITEIYRSVAAQTPATWQDKWNAWRYMAMLVNPRTHVRNVVGNAGFVPVRMVKNALATAMEEGVSYFSPNGIQRTKAALNPFSTEDRALIKAALADVGNVEEQLLGSGKFADSPMGKIEEHRKIFQNPFLEGVRRGNRDLMEAEDAIFSKTAYAGALAGYLKANGVTAELLAEATGQKKNASDGEAVRADTSLFDRGILENFKAARTSLIEFAKRNFPASVINAETGKEISIPRTGLDKFLSGNIPYAKYASGFHIPELIERARKVNTADNYHPDTKESIPTYEYYDSQIEIDGQMYNAHIRVKNTNMGDKYYGHTISEVDEIKIERPTRTSVPDDPAVQPENTGRSTSDTTLPQRRQGVKGKDAQTKAELTALLDRARVYAIKEAQKATYRDANDLSDLVSKRYRGSNPVGNAFNVLIDGTLPFRRTPANILARGLEYSPAGLVKGLTYDLAQVRKGEMTAAEAIDDIAAGLTGTGLVALGAFLAAQGLVSGGSSGDEEEEAMDELTGGQSYALSVGGKNYTLDWLAPEALPFFVGVELYNNLSDQNEGSGRLMDDVWQAVGSITEPMLEMSMLSGVQDLLDSVEYSDDKVMGALSTTVVSYLTQGIPTLFGQIERTGEAQRETTFIDRTGALTNDMQYTIGRVANRLPGEFQQIPYIDAWGRTEETGSVGERAFNNFLNPSYPSTEIETAVDRELKRLLEAGQSGVAPERVSQGVQVTYKERGDEENRKRYLSAEEYVTYATTKGETSYALVSAMMDSPVYKSMTDEEKADAIRLAYTYAGHVAAEEVTEGKHESERYVELARAAKRELGLSEMEYLLLFEEYGGTLVNGDKIRQAYQRGMEPAEYLSYAADVTGELNIAEQAKAIAESGLDRNGQEIAWLLAYPQWAERAAEAGVSPGAYIDYKIATYGIEADRDGGGRSVSGSKKEKVVAAIHTLDLTVEEKDRLYLAAGYAESGLGSTPWR